MPIIVSFEYIGEKSAALPLQPEVLLGYVHIYNPNSFDLNDWPVYVRFTQDNFSFSDNIHENGNNLRFRSLGGNLLNYFLGEWYQGEFGEAFVQIPTLSANSTTTIKVTYQPGTNNDLSNFSAVALQILSGLYAEWRFCHPSNYTIYDSGGSSWNGQIIYLSENYINKTTGYFDIALQSGYENWVDNGGAKCPFRDVTKTPPFTWEAFIYPSSGCNECQLIGTLQNQRGSQIYILYGDTIRALVWDGDYSATAQLENLNFENWLHVAGLFDENYIALYVNESNTSAAVPSNITDFNPDNNLLRIELNEDDITTWDPNTFIRADYIRHWSRILSESEITLLRNHYSVATSRFPNKVCVLNWTEDKPQVFIECS